MIIKWPVMRLFMALSLLLPVAAQSQDFSIVVIPDTQMYVENNPEIFEAQIDWIVANEVAENIIYVAHLGDLKDDQLCDTKTVNVGTGGGRSEWQIVDDAFLELDTAGIPYGVVPGNHDFNQTGGGCPNWTTQRPLTDFNTYFGPLRFAGQPWYGDPGVPTDGNRVINSNEDNFTLFDSGGVNFIAINLAYRQAANELNAASGTCNNSEVPWADALLKAYPNRLGIITTHYFLEQNPNEFGPYGQCVYDGLSNNPNLFMMLSAHERGEAWRVETTGRGGMQPVQVLLSDYQSVLYQFRDGDQNTPGDQPNIANINYSDLFGANSNIGDSGFMRIMRFDTSTQTVNINTFVPPVPFLGRMDTLASTYFPASGDFMDKDTASNLSFSYLGYVPTGSPVELVSCGITMTSGDLIDRGFFHPNYPGSSLDTVELNISSRAAGSFTIRLDARLNTYDGTLIASNSQTRVLSGVDTEHASYLFDMGGAAITPGSTVTFTLTQEAGPDTQVFFAVDAASHPLGVPDPTPSCDVDETNGTTPPLDTFRRDGLWIRINGLP
jgi:hypothetical protein